MTENNSFENVQKKALDVARTRLLVGGEEEGERQFPAAGRCPGRGERQFPAAGGCPGRG